MFDLLCKQTFIVQAARVPKVTRPQCNIYHHALMLTLHLAMGEHSIQRGLTRMATAREYILSDTCSAIHTPTGALVKYFLKFWETHPHN